MGVHLVANREVAAAERGQIIQRILVDGWTVAEAALFHQVPQRDVARWVAAYRRKGMASLHDPRAGIGLARRLAEWLRARSAGLGRRVRGESREPVLAPCVVLRRGGEQQRPR